MLQKYRQFVGNINGASVLLRIGCDGNLFLDLSGSQSGTYDADQLLINKDTSSVVKEFILRGKKVLFAE